MKLGTYVEVINFVDDTKTAGEYYTKLGLNAVADNVYGDGRYHLRLIQGKGDNPTVRYYGSDINALKANGFDIKDNILKSPQGVTIELTADAPPLKLPHDDITIAPETTRLGKFGELSVFVDDLEVEGTFWEKCGYSTLGKYTEPMPWGIWTDNLYVIGIHQYGMEEPFSITHFDPNMADINNALKEEGFALEAFMDDPSGGETMEHATLMTPFGIKFYFFTGDISKAAP